MVCGLLEWVGELVGNCVRDEVENRFVVVYDEANG
jgi:hypothetical protein